MLIRLRSSTLGILGLVAAVGLGLIAIASLQGWPSVFSGPLPQEPGPDFLRNDPIVAPASEVGVGAATTPLASRPASKTGGSQGAEPGGGSSALTAAHQVGAGGSQPQPVSTPQPSPAPTSTDGEGQPAPESSSPAVESAPANSRPSTGGGGSTPVAAGDESSGQSEEGHGGHHGSGPPAWAASDQTGPPGHSSGDDGHDGGWGHDDHDGGWGSGGHGGGWGHH